MIFPSVVHLNLPPTKLDGMDSSAVLEQIAGVYEQVRPEWLILPDYNDVIRIISECLNGAMHALRHFDFLI